MAGDESQEMQFAAVFFDFNKIQSEWEKRRAEQETPTKKRVTDAISKSDLDQDGALNKGEATRLMQAFERKASKLNLALPEEDLFAMFDADRDGHLDEHEVKAAMMVMWLMEGDGVNWDALTSPYQEEDQACEACKGCTIL